MGGSGTGPEEPPLRVAFKPRTTARSVIGVALLVCMAGALLSSHLAYRERDSTTLGIAVTLWVLTGIVWAVRSGTGVTRLQVHGGHLVVDHRGARLIFDLTSSLTRIEVHGKPGRGSWKVVFRRGDMSPFVIDRTMVDAREFMRVLRYYRPSATDPGRAAS